MFLRAGIDVLKVEIKTPSPTIMNQLKYSLTSLVGFHFRNRFKPVNWLGDDLNETLPEDLQCMKVRRTEHLSPNFRRVWFSGEDIAKYDTLNNLHARLLFKRGRGTPLEWPRMTSNGSIRWPSGDKKLDTRIYTIRHVDLEKNELAVDFFLSDHTGPATDWARYAIAGDQVGFIGPGAHGIVRAGYTIYVGDETGLPGIARCLEALGPSDKGIALIYTRNSSDQLKFVTPSGFKVHWIDAKSQDIANVFATFELPIDASNCGLWCGAEYSLFKQVKRFGEDQAIPKENTVAYAHWRDGMNEPDIVAAGSASVT